jgi:carboxylesterase type B
MASIEEESLSGKLRQQLHRRKRKAAVDRLKRALDLPGSVAESDAINQAAQFVEDHQEKENRQPKNARPKQNVLPKHVRPVMESGHLLVADILMYCVNNTHEVFAAFLEGTDVLKKAKRGQLIQPAANMDPQYKGAFTELELNIMLEDSDASECTALL